MLKEKEKERLLELVEILEYEAKTYREILNDNTATSGLKDCFNWITEKLDNFEEENESYL